MKAQILKISGCKTQKEFYSKFPSEEAFMKKHGKEFKKAQTGNNIATSNAGSFNIYNPYGDAMQSADMSGMQNSFGKPVMDYSDIEMPGHIQNPNFGKQQQKASDAYDTQELIGMTGDTSNPLGTDKLSSSVTGMGMDLTKGANMISGMKNAFGALKAEKDLLKKTKAFSGAANVVKRALTSNAFIKKPENKWFNPTDSKNIHNANELYNPQGGETDVLTQNGGHIFQNGNTIGGNPTQIQNTYGEGNSIYDDLGFVPKPDKAYQGGGPLVPYGGFGSGSDYTTNGGAQMGKALFGNTPFGEAAGLIGGALDPYAKKIKTFQNNINSVNAYAGRLNTAGQLHNQFSSNVQNGGDLELYEDGGWVSHDWQPQVIASFGDHSAKDVYDFAHEGMDTLRAGGHLGKYTPPSEHAMETYAMGGQLKTHWGGEAKTIARNPYSAGSGEMIKLEGANHNNDGIGISYGNTQNGSQGYAENGAKIEAETGEIVMEMENGGQIDPQTGQPSTEAVVLGNIPAHLKIAKAIGDPGLIKLITKYDGNTIKSIGNSLALEDIKATEYKNKSATIANKSDDTNIGQIGKKVAEMYELASKMRFKQSAEDKIKLANYQSAINDTKKEISYMKGKNISAEHLGKGLIKLDKDPITKNAPIESPYAKFGSNLIKAQVGKKLTDEKLIQQADMQGGELPELVISKPKIKQIEEEDDMFDYYMGDDESDNFTASLPTKTVTTNTKKPIGVVPYNKNKLMDYANMLKQFLPNAKLPGIDPRQFTGELLAMAQNQNEPIPMQQMHTELDPLTRVSYQDVRNQSTADFRDALRQGAFNPALAANVFGKKAIADQTSYAEEFRANQGLDDKIFGGNRAKVNQDRATNLTLNANQMDKQALALSKTKETNQKAIASIADKYMQHDARDLEFKVKSNMFPTFAYNASGNLNIKGAGYQPVIPQIYGGKSSIKQVPVYKDGVLDHYEMQEEGDDKVETAVTKNGGVVAKKNKKLIARNGSIVKSLKNL